MLRMGADSVFAVDVGSIDDTSPRNFPESVSGWWLLLNRLNPWSSVHSIPVCSPFLETFVYTRRRADVVTCLEPVDDGYSKQVDLVSGVLLSGFLSRKNRVDRSWNGM